MQNVYFISGLGADKRAFQFLNLDFCHPVFVDWIAPLPGDTMSSYAARLKEQVKDPAPVIVGLSLGGMMAVEMAKQFPVKQLILLSSAKTEKEIPYYLRLLRYLPLHKLVTASFLRLANQLAYRLMGIHKRKDKLIFSQMIKDADDRFMLWAVHQVVHWKNQSVTAHTVQIHGTKDILLPFRFVTADHAVEGGEHLMVLLHPEVISGLLKKIITGG